MWGGGGGGVGWGELVLGFGLIPLLPFPPSLPSQAQKSAYRVHALLTITAPFFSINFTAKPLKYSLYVMCDGICDPTTLVLMGHDDSGGGWGKTY